MVAVESSGALIIPVLSYIISFYEGIIADETM